MASKRVLRVAVLMCLVGAIGVGACGGGSAKKTAPPPDPVTMALMAPGVRTVVIPKQSTALTVVVPPCGLAETEQETTRTPPGSNQVIVPTSALEQTIAIQPCIQDAKSSGGSSTVLLSPGGTGSAASEESTPPNQLILPENSNVSRLIVPPCLVLSSSSGSGGGQSGGPNTVLPGARAKGAVTAPPCTVQMTSSSS